MRSRAAVLVAAVALMVASGARADSWLNPSAESAFHPEVPISALGRAATWLDPSHFHFSTSLSVGSGFGGTQALQVTSMNYQFRAPMFLSVSMGNSFGAGAASQGGKPFLEGLDFGYQPVKSMMIRVQYHDFRSQLQNPYLANPYFSPWAR
ncbi:MAG: hypothetical protein ACRENS_13940 [Candidatus Eiseniibacteriota bacterium]